MNIHFPGELDMATHPVLVRYDQPELSDGIASVLAVEGHREAGPQVLAPLQGADEPVASPGISTTDRTEARRKACSPDASWPEPDFSLLDTRRGDLPVFPVMVLPGFWR